jgi:creatinine amidohydrolase
MRIADLNWMQVNAYLETDDRVVVPLGSIEQHAYLSLAVDRILAERVSVDAAEPVGIPVFPAVSYGMTRYFSAFPGTISLTPKTYRRLIRDILDSLKTTGFRRVLFVNGHGGNSPARDMAGDWTKSNAEVAVRFHDWWKAPQTNAYARSLEAGGSHASWMENFPWTRLAEISMPSEAKPEVDVGLTSDLSPTEIRDLLGDGSFGGSYQRPDEEMLALWAVAVQETRMQLTEGW